VPGLTTLWMAVLADVGATLLVTLNGMRMLRAT
jgi:Cd2+/Zn2+-exporting ATPase